MHANHWALKASSKWVHKIGAKLAVDSEHDGRLPDALALRALRLGCGLEGGLEGGHGHRHRHRHRLCGLAGLVRGAQVGTRPPLRRLRRRLGPLCSGGGRPTLKHFEVRGQREVGRQRCIRQQCPKAGRGVELVVVGSRRAQQLVQGVQQVALPEGHVSGGWRPLPPPNELRPALF
eukprot:scaffold22261_cov62-Phaeocystis_antarctica.AAC.5